MHINQLLSKSSESEVIVIPKIQDQEDVKIEEELLWNCELCTFFNSENSKKCEICDHPKPSQEKENEQPKSEPQINPQEEEKP